MESVLTIRVQYFSTSNFGDESFKNSKLERPLPRHFHGPQMILIGNNYGKGSA